MITLAYEDFSDFPIGNVSEAPYTALGEYYVIDPKYYQGNWREATYWHGWKGEPGIMGLFDANLNLLRQWEPIHYASPLAPVNWVGDGTELILLSTHPKEGGMLDGFGRPVVLFPDDGHPYLCARALDVTGDGREEILTWDKNEIWIYTQDRHAPEGCTYRPRKNPLGNDSNYKASYSVPW